jgi:hypothetical protein
LSSLEFPYRRPKQEAALIATARLVGAPEIERRLNMRFRARHVFPEIATLPHYASPSTAPPRAWDTRAWLSAVESTA